MQSETKKQNISIKYQSKNFDITKKNPLFSEAKVYVMYHGENRNNSFISRADVDKSIGSIYNIPIVGEFIESEEDSEESNFGSHGGKVVIDDKGMKYIHTTRPVGVVPESAKVYWETVKDEKEREREYLVVDGALVWNRYEDEVNTLKGANFGQSMEIEVNNGWFDDESGNYNITDFAFSAFCILGIDGRKNGKVEPAFEDSKIITYSKDVISKEFKEMKGELEKYYESYAKGKEDTQVDLEKDKIKDEELTDEQKTAKDLEEAEKGENKEPETVQTETTGRGGDIIDDKETAEKQQGTSGDLDGATGTDTADTGSDARAIADANTDTTAGTDTSATTTTTTTDAGAGTADTTSEARTVADVNTDSSDYSKENEGLKAELSELKSELEELREFKKKADKEAHEQKSIELFNRLGLEEEDVKDLDIYKYSIEELEEKCFAILGKKTVSGDKKFSFEAESNKSNKVPLSQASAEKSSTNTSYGSLFKKYGNK